MPAKVIAAQNTADGSNINGGRLFSLQGKKPDYSGSNNSNLGEVRARKRLQKSATESSIAVQNSEEHTEKLPEESRSNFTSRRRQSVREPKALLGARPLELSPSKRSISNNLQSSYPAGRPPPPSIRPVLHSRQISIATNSHSNLGTSAVDNSTNAEAGGDTFQFLPAVNFDDFHTSLRQEPSVTNDTSYLRRNVLTSCRDNVAEVSGTWKGPGDGTVESTTSIEPETRIARSGSFLRRQNSTTNNQQLHISHSDILSPQYTHGTTKSRRQSHFPAPTPTTSASRPRKSVGPGVLTNGATEYSSLASEISSRNGRGEQGTAPEASMGDISYSRVPRSNLSARARSVKAKSFHAPPGVPQDYLFPAMMTLEGSWAKPVDAPYSPNGTGERGNATPSSSRRLSVMPGHVTGLGARTISPTDARRIKRMSMISAAPPLPFAPPISLPDQPCPSRLSIRDSPSLIPRKSVTPSSNRTTPDHNRKSYSSVVSTSSSTSYNSLKVSTTVPRVQQSSSLSRLPTLKSRSENAAAGPGEEVPPVPAIPKAYESPKTEYEAAFFSTRKPSHSLDVGNVNDASGIDYVPPQKPGTEPLPSLVDTRQRRGLTVTKFPHSEDKTMHGIQSIGKNLIPLRLPPINLQPLSTPTADKIAALQDKATEVRPGIRTPPPRKGGRKTPSTPMTASKAGFFSRYQHTEESEPLPTQIRSSSSHYALRSAASSYRATSSSSSNVPLPPEHRAGRKAVSPFVSSSLPKANLDFGTRRATPSGDQPSNPPSQEIKNKKLTGPREQTTRKASKAEALSQTASPVEKEPQSFGSSLRRKLSLSRKRSASKTEILSDVDGENPPQPPIHDAMPPPRLPASATWNGPWLSNPSPVQKSNYLHTRRKASNPETIIKHNRTRSGVSITDGVSDKDASRLLDTRVVQAAFKVDEAMIAAASKPGPSRKSTGSTRSLGIEPKLDRDDLVAEEEMRRLASRRKETETAAKFLDELRQRAMPRECVSPVQALRSAQLNIFERGEIIDYKEVYFCGTNTANKYAGDLQAEAANFGYDDDRGDYNIVCGDHLAYRYEVIDILGKGSFGQVVRCIDHKTGGLVAIKIIRNKKRFHQQALVEVSILQKLREWDPHNKYSMVNFVQSFYFRAHLCISTELLGMNLYELIKVHDFKGFSLKLIRRFTKQVLNSLVLLKSHKVIHCDLKPENILLAHPAQSEIKVIDFGSSCLENEKVYTYIQSRFYRSPEVILGMTYGMPIDMWSIGCILAELLTGYPIFPGENEQEQLACIMEIFGPPDKNLIEKSTRKKLFFDSTGKPRLTVSSKGKRRRPSSKTLQQALKCDDEAFLDFIARCLRWDPERRLKPDEAIHHEFLTGIKTVTSRNLRTLPSSSANVNSSPIKRFNSVHIPSNTIRPLPEPPATSLKSGAATTARVRESRNGGSPSRPTQKRYSTMTGLSNGTSAKKLPGSVSMASMSALPRLGGPRLVSGKPDLASAAAAAATMVGAHQSTVGV